MTTAWSLPGWEISLGMWVTRVLLPFLGRRSVFFRLRSGPRAFRAVGYFTRRLLFYAFLACLCEALVIEAFPTGQQDCRAGEGSPI